MGRSLITRQRGQNINVGIALGSELFDCGAQQVHDRIIPSQRPFAYDARVICSLAGGVVMISDSDGLEEALRENPEAKRRTSG